MSESLYELRARGERDAGVASRVRAHFKESEEMFSPAASTFFDLLRFSAAVIVVMEHLASRLFVGYGYLDSPGIWTQLLYWLNLLGSPAVVVFFVLSGLFISRSIYRTAFLQSREWDWPDYLNARLSRLWLVLIPALIVTFLVDFVADANGWVNKGAGAEVFVGNALFVQTILVPQFGSNAPLWSISNEFWYYMIFPALFLAAITRTLWHRVALIALAIALLVFIGPRKSAYFLMWLLGALVMVLPTMRRFGSGRALVVALAFLAIASLLRPLVARGRLMFDGLEIDLFWPDLLVAGAAFLVMRIAFVFFAGRQHLFNSSVDGLIRGGAGYSFSLYVLHYPFINSGYFLAHAYGFDGFQPGIVGVLVEVIVVLILCSIAWFFASLTEAHTGAVRRASSRVFARVPR